MQNDFEKDITRRLQDFSLAPQPEIWQRVAAALPPQKKRRRLVFWWWLPVVAVLLAGGTWLMTEKHPKAPLADTTAVPAHQNTSSIPAPDTQNVLPENTASYPSGTHADSIQTVDKNSPRKQPVKKEKPIAKPDGTHEDDPIFTEKKQERPPTRAVRITRANRALAPAVSAGNTSTGQSIHEEIEQLLLPVSGVVETLPVAPASTTLKAAVALQQARKDSIQAPDSVSVALQKTDTANTATTDTSTLRKTPVAVKSATRRKPSQWMLEAAIGVSNTHKFTGGNSNARYDNLYSAGPTTGGQTGVSPATRLLDLPQSSYSLSLGITRKTAFAPHWNGQLTLRYQLLSSLQRHGSSIDTASGSSQNSATGNRVTGSYYPGDTQTHHNYIHQLQLAPRIAYTINPKAASPVDFHTGFSIAYNVAGNQLLHDYRTRTYIRSADYSTRWLLSAEIGAGIFIRQKIYAGITYQHGLSNVARPALQSDFRWRVWQVRLGIPLFNRPSK